ncbi:MAG: hypothetical protein ABGY75_17105, partial [Gemmataceae bacterium]
RDVRPGGDEHDGWHDATDTEVRVIRPDSHLARTELQGTGQGAGTETGKDFRAFEMALARQRDGFRSLLDVLGSGPLPPEDATAYADVYQRGMDEVRQFLVPSSGV